MVVFNISKEQSEKYKQSLSGMERQKKRLKNVKGAEGSAVKIAAEYRLELLNVIEGYMRVVVDKSDKRFQVRKRGK